MLSRLLSFSMMKRIVQLGGLSNSKMAAQFLLVMIKKHIKEKNYEGDRL